MLVIISPSKTLDFENAPCPDNSTIPELLDDSQQLVQRLQSFTPEDLAQLMDISQRLAELNAERFANWHTPFRPENAKPALFVFKGDVYEGLNAERYTKKDVQFAQKHLRILSGLYGVLRPLDLIQPYRLEMGTRLETPWGRNLYEFWGTRITEALNRSLKGQRPLVLINLASQEYFKAVKPEHLEGEIITPVFKEKKGQTYKTIAIHAKKARGLMASYIVQNRLSVPEELKQFDRDGYQFDKTRSSDDQWVFTRG